MTEHADQASPRTSKRGLRNKIMIGAALAGVASVAGLAFAEWLATGTGEGYARSGTAEALTTEFATANESLYPGGTGDLVLRIHNPNPFPVTVTSVTPNGPITSDDPACDAAGHGVTFAGATGLSLDVAAASSQTFTLSDALAMSLDSPNECQGAQFTVPVSLNGGSGGGGGQTWYADADADGFGDPSDTVQAASPPSGYVADGTDCDDADATVFPGATEVLGDGKDNDCDGVIDEGLPLQTWHPDADGDGFGDFTISIQDVSPPAGHVADGTDCDDSDATTNPNATEVADGVDNDCDGLVDDGAPTSPWYRDLDQDDFGDSAQEVLAVMQPPGYTPLNGDCDDSDASVHPGATEVVGDGKDNDCDGQIDEN